MANDLSENYFVVGSEEPKTKRLATDRGISDEVAQGYMETIWVPVKGNIVRATEDIERDKDIFVSIKEKSAPMKKLPTQITTTISKTAKHWLGKEICALLYL